MWSAGPPSSSTNVCSTTRRRKRPASTSANAACSATRFASTASATLRPRATGWRARRRPAAFRWICWKSVGLIAKRDQGPGHYDRFRDRIQFPIRNMQGQAIGFGGRILPSSPLASRAPKYYNSCETPLFSKSESLYGIDVARHAAASAGFLAVVEGYTDVLMAHQMGVLPVVATMGTALNVRHVRQLRRFAPRVVLVFDADAGGDAGVDRRWRSSSVRTWISPSPRCRTGWIRATCCSRRGRTLSGRCWMGRRTRWSSSSIRYWPGTGSARRGRPAAGGGVGAGRDCPGADLARTGRRGQDAVAGQPDRSSIGSQGGDRMGAPGRITKRTRRRDGPAAGPRRGGRRRGAQGPGRGRRSGSCSKCCWPSRTWFWRRRPPSTPTEILHPGLRRCSRGCTTQLTRENRPTSTSCAADWTTRAWRNTH